MSHYWFISTQHRRPSKLALMAFSMAFFVILLGAYTRLTNSGLSCPDWPNCYGYLTAPHTSQQIKTASQLYPSAPVEVGKAWNEMRHRYAAGLTGIPIILLALTLIWRSRMRDLKSCLIGVGLIALLGSQVLLGKLTVTEQLKPVIVLGHLLTGFSILSLLWWTFLDSFLRSNPRFRRNTSRLLPWLWLGFIIVIAQITLGGWVSTHYAGLACIDFPYCNTQFIPALQWQHLNTDLITIHMLHRFGAYLTATYISLLALFMLRQPATRTIACLLLTLITLQVTLGILNIIWLRPVWIAMIHHTVALILLLTMITALVKTHLESQDNHYGTWSA